MGGEAKLCAAFEGTRRIAAGDLASVAAEVKRVLDRGETAPVLIFDDETSEQVEVDFRGTVEDVLARLRPEMSPPGAEAEEPRGPGRPKLGVVAREVTLLPRHWEWLGEQSGGASAALRRLVEDARRSNADKDRVRKARESAYRFLSTMGGNLPGFEEANRALFAGDAAKFDREVEAWPPDVRDHARKLARASF